MLSPKVIASASPKPILRHLPRRPVAKHRLLGAALALGTPVGYMIASHLKWMETPEKKRRMAVMHAGFWGGMLASVLTVHHIGFWQKNPITAWLGFASAATYPILGFLAARQINKRFLSPDKQNRLPDSPEPETLKKGQGMAQAFDALSPPSTDASRSSAFLSLPSALPYYQPQSAQNPYWPQPQSSPYSTSSALTSSPTPSPMPSYYAAHSTYPNSPPWQPTSTAPSLAFYAR